MPELKELTACELVRNEISKYDGWDVNIMSAIAQAENGTCNPARHNLTNSETHRDSNGNIICIGSYGVLQVGCLHYNGEDVNSLSINVELAYKVFTNRQKWGNGYEAWSTFTNGAYRKYMQ